MRVQVAPAVRALVISDTHFGAWTGDDLLRYDWARERLAPHLDDIDELVLLGDLFDLLFATVPDAFAAADPFIDLIAEKLAGKRLVWLAGNHDRHIIQRELEDLVEQELATGEPAEVVGTKLRERNYFQRFLERRLPDTEIAIEYPTHWVGDVLCCHGHYLDAHVQGSLSNRLFTRGLRRVGGVKTRGRSLTIDDYEAATGPLTELLYTVAQLPSGTAAQARADRGGRARRGTSSARWPPRAARSSDWRATWPTAPARWCAPAAVAWRRRPASRSRARATRAPTWPASSARTSRWSGRCAPTRKWPRTSAG